MGRQEQVFDIDLLSIEDMDRALQEAELMLPRDDYMEQSGLETSLRQSGGISSDSSPLSAKPEVILLDSSPMVVAEESSTITESILPLSDSASGVWNRVHQLSTSTYEGNLPEVYNLLSQVTIGPACENSNFDRKLGGRSASSASPCEGERFCALGIHTFYE